MKFSRVQCYRVDLVLLFFDWSFFFLDALWRLCESLFSPAASARNRLPHRPIQVSSCVSRMAALGLKLRLTLSGMPPRVHIRSSSEVEGEGRGREGSDEEIVYLESYCSLCSGTPDKPNYKMLSEK